jgi:putative tryptophan/tyrosine transport system substrate-binding protein
MKRRHFIILLGGAAAAWPLAAGAQQPAMPLIGFLHSGSPRDSAYLVEAFRQGLRETGHIEGHNVAIEYGWAQDQPDRLRALAGELVRRPVALIATSGGTVSALTAKAATATIPIVFATGADPVESGLVVSLNRPGGNITGVSFLAKQTDPKRLELLHEIAPKATPIAILVNPTNPNSEAHLNEVRAAGHAIGQQLFVVRASTKPELYAAFAALAEQRAGALLIFADPFFSSQREQIALLAVRHALPTIYFLREYALAGGLMSYGTSIADAHRQVGIYAGRILKGEKSSDLPVVQPTKFELVINLKAANALGIDVPPTLLARADEVIE